MSHEDRSDPGDDSERRGSLTGLLNSVELLRRAQDGQDKALERLIERYLPKFRRWARHRLPDWARGGWIRTILSRRLCCGRSRT